MRILGISGGVKAGNQDGAAALVVDGRLVAAAEEERFTGVKFANGMLPRQAVRFCLGHAKLDIRDVDLVVFPGETYIGFRELLRRFFTFQFGHSPPIELVDHHAAHAASTYFGSGFDRALVVTLDNSGDGKSTTIRRGAGGVLGKPTEILRPNSLGLFYSAVTQYLGFQKDSDEYKVMGMAAYGRPNVDFSSILEIDAGGYRFRSDFIQGVQPGQPSPSKQERLFDEFPLPYPPRVPGSPIEQIHYDVAASAQARLEQAVLALVRSSLAVGGPTDVCFAGGVALNCLMNQKIRELPEVGRLYVPPVCSDAGLALGAAYLGAAAGGESIEPLRHAYWGPEPTSEEIRKTLDRAGARYRAIDDPANQAAERLAEGQIIAWFQGRMEYGPRALGARSILADPRREGMKDAINQRIKFREEFRPIAPSVLHEAADEYFADYADSPYMTQTFTAKEKAVRSAPAIVHADGTARLQSVHQETSPLYAEMIRRFQSLTGTPMVVNTSFNAYNDPIACEPFQALRTFFTTGLDALFLGEFLLEKVR